MNVRGTLYIKKPNQICQRAGHLLCKCNKPEMLICGQTFPLEEGSSRMSASYLIESNIW